MRALGLKPLPVRASLAQYKNQANRLIKVHKAGNREAIHCIRQHHPDLPGRANTNDRNSVSDSAIRKLRLNPHGAQSVVARWHGFESWPVLQNHVKALARKESPVLQFELAVEAIVAGDVATLKSLLGQNPGLARARSTREHHATLLHYLGANGVEQYHQKTPKNAVTIAKVLLSAGSEVDADLDYGVAARKRYPERIASTTLGLVATSSHPAAMRVQLALLKTLLDAGASRNGLPRGWNPLLAALHNGRRDAAEYLARRGARLDIEGASGTGRLKALKGLIERNGGRRAKTTMRHMESGLMWACEYGRTSIVAFLLQQGLDVCAQPHGETGLHWAAYGGHAKIVKVVLKHQAPVEAKDQSFGGTPLGWALYAWCDPPPEANPSRYYEVVALLVGAGAKVDSAWLADPTRERPLVEKIRADRRMLATLRAKRQFH